MPARRPTSWRTASPYLINTLPTIGDEIEVLSKYLAGEGKKKAAILFENDAAGISGRDDYLEVHSPRPAARSWRRSRRSSARPTSARRC